MRGHGAGSRPHDGGGSSCKPRVHHSSCAAIASTEAVRSIPPRGARRVCRSEATEGLHGTGVTKATGRSVCIRERFAVGSRCWFDVSLGDSGRFWAVSWTNRGSRYSRFPTRLRGSTAAGDTNFGHKRSIVIPRNTQPNAQFSLRPGEPNPPPLIYPREIPPPRSSGDFWGP